MFYFFVYSHLGGSDLSFEEEQTLRDMLNDKTGINF